ncbi:ATP-binding protein [Dermabacter sp. Marseille-Q3180]|uniref:HAMP domain-containing sensor histidine kinase n=1 Tax=Dermabacter sp. Marseille-Q3180 TaxID=2758090 RepID=UPI0020259781|nr:ATP-binding protein [Dermabacter sp. Marseille-Q3180]
MRVPTQALDLSPLQRFGSFKIKLGVIVAVSVLVAALLGWAGSAAGLNPLLFIPLTVLAALVVTQILARGMTRPLREMTVAAKAMALGDYGRRVTTKSRDEVGQLASAFNTMSAELARTDELRRDLVANVSHELRTPVAALRGQLENMVDGVTAATTESLEIALGETERLTRLVTHLLDLSRLEAGVMDIERERIALTPFLHEAVDSAQLAARVQERDVRFVIDVKPQELSVTADPARIHQVIANLLDNASRHSPSGGTIYVRAWEFKSTGSIAIEVRDQGPGIAEADREAVFERFERGGTPDQSGGTGLGLAIARWAVELHGGTIEVIDHPGRDSADPSSTIRVLLPNTPLRDERALG